MIYRISPSKLENFRAYIDEEYNGYITLESMTDYLKGKSVWKPSMNYGSAIHAVLEYGHAKYLQKGDICVIKEDDFPEPITLTVDELAPVIRYRQRHPNLISEIKLTKSLFINNDEVQISMKVDGIEGVIVHEHKNPENSWHIDDYERSVQWKIHLIATGAECVQYNIFCWKKPKDKLLSITLNSFQLFRYPTIEEDIKEVINMVINFCNLHGLTEFIVPKKFDD